MGHPAVPPPRMLHSYSKDPTQLLHRFYTATPQILHRYSKVLHDHTTAQGANVRVVEVLQAYKKVQ